MLNIQSACKIRNKRESSQVQQGGDWWRGEGGGGSDVISVRCIFSLFALDRTWCHTHNGGKVNILVLVCLIWKIV